jgi:hypothetical protein
MNIFFHIPDNELSISTWLFISNENVADLLWQPTDYLIENREELIQRYGWKSYGILLAQSMWYSVPQFFPIPTNFFVNNSRTINQNDLNDFNSLMELLSSFWPDKKVHPRMEGHIRKTIWFEWKIVTKVIPTDTEIDIGILMAKIVPLSEVNPLREPLWNEEEFIVFNSKWGYCSFRYRKVKSVILEDFLLSNLAVFKYILNDLNDENIFGKYSFLIDAFVEKWWWYSYETYEYQWYEWVNKCIRIKSDEGNVTYDVWYDHDYIYNHCDSISSYIREKILLDLWLVKYKTLEETDFAVEQAYKNIAGYDWGLIRGRIEHETNVYNLTQLKNFLWIINENTNFSPEQIVYLQEVFSQFKEYPFISVRSSANIEDAWEKNYAWSFYTGFCNTVSFEGFLKEVKKVLTSTKNVSDKDVQMWITVMAVLWKVNHKKTQEEINFINDIYHDSAIGRQIALQNEEKYYYPEWWWVMLTSSFSGRVSISSEFWLPIWITAGSWKWFHHDFHPDWTLVQARIMEFTSCGYERPEYIMWFNSKTDSISSIGNYNLRAYKLQRLSRHNDIYWAFSLDTYQKLVKIWKELENKWGYSLDIEFVVHNWTPYIIQVRPYTDKYKKPEWFEHPNLEWKEIILRNEDINTIYCMWYLNEGSVELKELTLGMTDIWTDTRNYNKSHIFAQLIEQEQTWNPYVFYLDSHLSVFPEINKSEFPNFKWFIFIWNETSIASHISMMLRQNETPTICLNYRSVSILNEWSNIWIFIDSEKNEFVLYK